MHKNVYLAKEKISDLLSEIKKYSDDKKRFIESVEKIERRYQKRETDYFGYKKLISDALKGKTKKEWLGYYNAYISTLLKQLEYFNSQIFYYMHNEEPHLLLKAKPEPKKVPVLQLKNKEEKIHEISEIKKDEKLKEEKPEHIYKLKEIKEIKKKKEAEKELKKKEEAAKEVKPQIRLKRKEKLKETYKKPVFKLKIKNLFKKKADLPKRLKEVKYEFPSELKDKITRDLLSLEARRIEYLVKEKGKYKFYRPTSIGALANISMRNISYKFIRKYPDFFRGLYNALRLADLGILSSTYVNLMFFFTVIAFTVIGVLFLIKGYYQSMPLIFFTVDGLAVGLISALLCFLTFYLYPFMKAKDRSRSINTNLPFAIDHMSSITNSGVPPINMFRLIAESEEYEEVSNEVKEIIQLVDLYGYDLLTAIKAVSSTTPSTFLEEFFHGLVSVIESGGDIRLYLEQKSVDALLNYRLERQQYLRAISTYSDVYIGLMITAPVFLIATLALVSILGGKIAGINVDTIIIFGTYVLIPLMNIGFLLFLEFTQPEA